VPCVSLPGWRSPTCHHACVTAAPPPDPRVPALEVLLSPEAAEVLGALVAASGLVVEEAVASQVRYSPGKSVVVQYRTTLGNGGGERSEPMLVAASGITVPEGTFLVESGQTRIAMWRFPNDPFLPGLPLATDSGRTSELLTRLGAPTDQVRIRTRAYRATRRAVVEAAGVAGTVYMKVLRLNRIAALQQRHVHLAPHLPIPHSLGWSRRHGILAMQALGGTTLRQALEGGALDLPSPQALISLLDQFPVARPEMPGVAGARERASDHAKLLRAVLPTAAGAVDAILSRVSVGAGDDAPVAVHGDFHSSQVLIDRGNIVGLVDVDTAGVGHRGDDLANMIGQLATLALISKQPGAFAAYTALLFEEFQQHCPGDSLRRRVAAVILGLATGPFRVQMADWPQATMQRLELAARWLDSVGSEEIPFNP